MDSEFLDPERVKDATPPEDEGWLTTWEAKLLIGIAAIYLLHRVLVVPPPARGRDDIIGVTNKRKNPVDRATNTRKDSVGRATNTRKDSVGRATNKNNMKFHVLIPCHVESDRRYLLFVRCLQSVAMQVYDDKFEVFIGISGSASYREQAVEAIQLMSVKSSRNEIEWHHYDTGKNAVPQMEHLRSLVERSAEVDLEAYLMFLDNDDMFHPKRLAAFREGFMNLPLPPGTPLPLSCKLLLNENMEPENGQLDKLVGPGDDFKWKRDRNLRNKIQLVPTAQCDEMDATEYVDFAVPTSVMQKFFRLTPVGVTSHKFCDLRLLAILERLSPVEIGDLPHYPWLLAHYKTTMNTKLHNFDTNGNGQVLNDHSRDQASMGIIEPTNKDAALSQQFRKLSPGQVAMCRGHLESMVIQAIGWDGAMLADMKREKTQELNKRHGKGFGDVIWEEVVKDLSMLFKENEINLNRGAWECMIPGYY